MTSIRKKIGFGIFYTALSKYSNIFFSIVIGAVLARLLGPEEFGTVAIVMVLVTFFQLLTDFGIGTAIIQNRELNEKDIQSIFSFSLLLSVILSFCFFLLGPCIASFYDKPQLVNITRLLSLAVLFYSLSVVPNALNLKKLRFKQISIITVSTQFFTGLIAIFLAYKGFSYYALIIKSVCDGLFLFIAYYVMDPIKITFAIRMSSIRRIAHFSTFQFLFNFINYFSRNADNLLIGRFFNPAALGYYDKSYRLMMVPVQNLTHVITPVLLPVLSEYQHDKDKIFNQYMRIVELLATIGFPLSVFLYFSAPEIITILYGPLWNESIPIFKLLALTVGIQMVLSSTGTIFQTINRTDLLFLSGLLSSFFMVGSIAYGVFIGRHLELIGYGLIVAFIINFFQSFYILIKSALNSSLIIFYKSLIFPFILSFFVYITLCLLNKFNISNVYCSFLLKGIIFILDFILICILFPNKCHFIKNLFSFHSHSNISL